ncbi:MAG: hypothetical protein U1E36_02075 [Rickettsiales bacterium]
MTAALFTARAGDLEARQTLFDMGLRGESKDPVTDQDIVSGLKGFSNSASGARGQP